MLTRMGIHNFALIERMQLKFHKGITIFTGETGAGKSILMDAFSILLGERASSEFIRHEKDSFLVEGVFDISNNEILKALLEEKNIICDENELFLSRSFNRQGKTTILANDQNITLKSLKELGPYLADIHGQYSSQSLLDVKSHALLLDNYNSEGKAAFIHYQELFKIYEAIQQQLRDMTRLAEEREREMDMLRWQIDEIMDAQLKPKEDIEIAEELEQLDNYEYLLKTLNGCYDAFYEDPTELLSQISSIREELKGALRYAPSLKEACELLDSAYFQLDEVAHSIENYKDSISFSEERYTYCQTRDTLIYSLKKKYGSTVEDILSFMDKAQERLEYLENISYSYKDLEGKRQALEAELVMAYEVLRHHRLRNSQLISKALKSELELLGMPQALFSFLIEDIEDTKYNALGAKTIELLFSANAGEPLQPLVKIASGGEISRIALACKSVFTTAYNKTLVFDEIDVGISGEIALKVAQRILALGQNTQVFCITHMPQTASIRGEHYHLAKEAREGRTLTNIVSLNEEAHIRQIASMISGEQLSPQSIETAKELIQLINKA